MDKNSTREGPPFLSILFMLFMIIITIFSLIFGFMGAKNSWLWEELVLNESGQINAGIALIWIFLFSLPGSLAIAYHFEVVSYKRALDRKFQTNCKIIRAKL